MGAGPSVLTDVCNDAEVALAEAVDALRGWAYLSAFLKRAEADEAAAPPQRANAPGEPRAASPFAVGSSG